MFLILYVGGLVLPSLSSTSTMHILIANVPLYILSIHKNYLDLAVCLLHCRFGVNVDIGGPHHLPAEPNTAQVGMRWGVTPHPTSTKRLAFPSDPLHCAAGNIEGFALLLFKIIFIHG